MPGDDIEFSGAGGEFTPSAGMAQNSVYSSGEVSRTYADKNFLDQQFSSLVDNLTAFKNDLEAALSQKALIITSDPEDSKLQKANTQSWPTELGTPSNFIGYSYYNYLEVIGSRSAEYIRKRYEEAARDITGTNALDLVVLVNIILHEANLAKEFADTYVGSLNDPSEHRTIEIIQDWTESALRHTERLKALFTKEDTTRQLPQADIEQITSDEAKNAQALFKVNLNKLNNDVTYNIGFIRKNFGDQADVFYRNFLGNAIRFRLNVTSKILPVVPGLLGKEVNASKDSLDKNLRVLLADQVRRIQFFEDKMLEVETHLDMRDHYRAYIQQLEAKGKAITVGSRNTLAVVRESSDQVAFFTTVSQNAATPSFQSLHNALDGVGDPSAHPQYLLKDGDTITGDIAMNSDTKLDGLVPHLHAHTGGDGSSRIHGEDIIPGSVSPIIVDGNNQPSIPTNLKLISMDITTSTVTAVISWDGDAGDTFEVQIAVI